MSLSHLDQDSRHEPDRKVSPPIEWMPSLRCWCVFDASIITSILKSTDFVEPDFTELHSEVGRKVGIDCSALVHVLHYISTANEGERHAEIRRDTARVIAANADAAKQHTARAVHEIRAFDLLCNCRPAREVPLFALFAAKHERDAANHAILRQVLPHCVITEFDVPLHNVLHHLDKQGELQSFYAKVFDSV